MQMHAHMHIDLAIRSTSSASYKSHNATTTPLNARDYFAAPSPGPPCPCLAGLGCHVGMVTNSSALVG